ncbi:MAG: aminotransferase class I/II-fold pyridoxal phosphate-dependent enzyme [Desulfobulbales bacterium]
MANGYENVLQSYLDAIAAKGIRKREENIITGINPPEDGHGPRYYLSGQGDKPFLLLNSNSYLGLSLHPQVIAAEEEATQIYGTGPGAVRFISGTFQSHVRLEERLAAFHGREAGMIFSSAYAAVMGVLPQLISGETLVISDELNHNCIINAIRLARPAAKAIYPHLDMEDLEKKVQKSVGQARRVVLVTDGVFSMRGDYAPLNRMKAITEKYDANFEEGIITVVDDSHGVGVFGKTGRGTEEYTEAKADVLIATLGKALGVNGGYVVASRLLIDYLRETAPFYIYSNPVTQAEAAAALASLDIINSPAGLKLLERVRYLTRLLENGLLDAGYEIISGEHPIVPLMIRDTAKTAKMVRCLFAHGVLVTGLQYPVVPEGEEEIRLQVSARHTAKDINYVLGALEVCKAG